MARTRLNQVYRRYKRIRVKRDAAEVGRKGPEFVDALQGAYTALVLAVYSCCFFFVACGYTRELTNRLVIRVLGVHDVADFRAAAVL